MIYKYFLPLGRRRFHADCFFRRAEPFSLTQPSSLIFHFAAWASGVISARLSPRPVCRGAVSWVSPGNFAAAGLSDLTCRSPAHAALAFWVSEKRAQLCRLACGSVASFITLAIRLRALMNAHTDTHTQTHTHTHRQIHTDTHTQTHRHTQMHRHRHTHIDRHRHTQTHTHRHTQTQTHTQTCTPHGVFAFSDDQLSQCWGQCEESKRDSILRPVIGLKDRMWTRPEPCPRVRKPLLVKTRSGDFFHYTRQTEIAAEVRLPLLD